MLYLHIQSVLNKIIFQHSFNKTKKNNIDPFREEGEKEEEEKNDDIYEDEEDPLTEEEEEVEERMEEQTQDISKAEETSPSIFSNIVTWFLSLFGFCDRK